MKIDFNQAAINFEVALNDLGLSIGTHHWLAVDPASEEAKSLNTHAAYRGQVFTSEAYEQLKQKLENDGFTEHYHSIDPNYLSKTWGKEGSPIKLYIKVELSKEDECAKLKARLAELGCHY